MGQAAADSGVSQADRAEDARASLAVPPTAPSPLRRDALLVAVIAAGALLRFWHLGGQSLWYDEWLSAEAVSGGLGHVVHHVANREGIAPTYFVILWGWVRLFGDGAVAMRTLSVLIGTATIPVAYAIAIELHQRRAVARIAAVLVAISPMLVWYSQEARPYTLVAFLGGLTLWAFARVRNSGQPRDLYRWGLICACALAVHYFAAFIVVAEGIAVLASRRFRWRQLVLSCVPSAVVVVGLLPIALRQYSHSPNHQWISAFALNIRLTEAARAAVVGPGPPNTDLALVGGIVVAGAAVLIVGWGSDKERSAAGLCAAIASGAVAIALLAVVVGVDVLLGRYLIAALVPFIIAVAVGLGVRRARWVGAVGLGGSLRHLVDNHRVGSPRSSAAEAGLALGRQGVRQRQTERLLLFNTAGELGRPLLYYLPDAAVLDNGRPASVSEIDVLVAKPTTKPCNTLVGMACGLIFLGAPLPGPVASQFRSRNATTSGSSSINRYIVARPVDVRLAQLVTAQDLPGSLAVVTGSLRSRQVSETPSPSWVVPPTPPRRRRRRRGRALRRRQLGCAG